MLMIVCVFLCLDDTWSLSLYLALEQSNDAPVMLQLIWTIHMNE